LRVCGLFVKNDVFTQQTSFVRETEGRDLMAEATALKPSNDQPGDAGGVSGARLKTYLERIERLEEEKSGLADDIKDIYAEAKAFGFDVKTLRQIVRLRKIEIEKRREADELLELYKSAIGME
jgi:uncharacterized protein (UPF0335 family)